MKSLKAEIGREYTAIQYFQKTKAIEVKNNNNNFKKTSEAHRTKCGKNNQKVMSFQYLCLSFNFLLKYI